MNLSTKTAVLACCWTLTASLALAQTPNSPAPTLADDGRSVVVGRYSTESTTPPPELVEPLDTVAALTFPRQNVKTIEDAIEYTLARSGYRYVATADATARTFLDLPLPESQRQIGPYSVRTILNVLLGTAWLPIIKPADRTVFVASRIWKQPVQPVQSVQPVQPQPPKTAQASALVTASSDAAPQKPRSTPVHESVALSLKN